MPQPTRRTVVRGVAVAASTLLLAPLADCTDAGKHHDGSAGPTLSEGSLVSRFMSGPVRWRMALPTAGSVSGLIVALHGFGANADMAFDLGLPTLSRARACPWSR